MSASAAAVPEQPRRPRFGPIVENRAARDPGATFKIVAFNARGGGGINGILKCLSRPPLNNPSIILLCEADSRTARSFGHEVASVLAERLGMSCAYLPEFGFERDDGEIVAHLGNAILSAVPIRDARAIAMPSPRGLGWHPRLPRRYRRVGSPSGLAATVNLGGAPVALGVAHLHSRCAPSERARQMSAYLAEFPQSGPAIFGGDLNTTTTQLADARALALTALRIVLDAQRFRHPESREPLFGLLRAAGLEVRGVNADGTPTFTFSKFIPTIFRALTGSRSASCVPSRGLQGWFPRALRFSLRASPITISSRSTRRCEIFGRIAPISHIYRCSHPRAA
jgi:endonuclease/exonuclease/phosphatase family metal-dependent hydrolase